MKRMLEKQAGLRKAIEGLEREIAVLRTMIREKDVAIGDKERRIYELKVGAVEDGGGRELWCWTMGGGK